MAFVKRTSFKRLASSKDIERLVGTILLPPAGVVTGGVAADKWSITQDLTAASSRRDSNDKLSKLYGEKIKDVKNVIGSIEDPLQRLMFIDATQRLGIDYHFQEEIKEFLEQQFMEINLKSYDYETLFEVSLCFRLLRQEGFDVPTEIFDKFLDKEGRFNDISREEITGLMELYEATQLNSLEEENVLIEAAKFSEKNLKETLELLDENEASMIRNTLKYPYHKSLSTFMAKRYLKNFEGIYECVKPLHELARMELKMAQHMHRQELSQISKWWDDLKKTMDLKLARDQPLKWYAWTMASITDTGSSELRIELSKAISFIYIIDDIFDIYGTLDQLTLFTEAIKRWEDADIDQLPDYMKMCFKALCHLTKEIGYEISKNYGHNPTVFLRNTWETLCDAFLAEAKWFATKELPNTDEYLKVARVSSGIHVVVEHTFFLLGLGATKESEMCLKDISGLTSAIAMILRLSDDLGSAKDENQDGNDGSYIDCYVQEHGVTVDIARKHVCNMIANEWGRLNKENLLLTKFSASFTRASLNLARMVPLMYSYDDDHSLPLLERHIKTLFRDNSLIRSIA